MKKIILATVAVLCFGVAHADVKLSKSELKELTKSAQWNDNASYLSKDGKVRYSAHYELDKDGRPKLVAKKSYLPAVTDGINRTPKTSYFAISPKTLKYVGKAAKGANAVGIGLLMIDVLGEGIDWALDPANNSIKINRSRYRNHEADRYLVDYHVHDLVTAKQTTVDFFSRVGLSHFVPSISCSYNPDFNNSRIDCHYDDGSRVFPYHDTKTSVQVMSEAEFDQAVRTLAKSGNINAKQVILDAAKDEIADGKHDSEIIRLADDISQDTATEEEPQPNNPTDPSQGTDTDPKTDTPTNPNTGTGTAIGTEDTPKDDTPNKTSSDLPAFCDWATIVCEFIGVKPDMPDVPVPTKDIELKNPAEFDKDYVDFDGQCPADVSVDVDMGFSTHTISFGFSPICDFVQNYLRLVVLFGAYLFATIHISSAFKV